MKARVTTRALFQRINRALGHEEKQLMGCLRNAGSWKTLGDYYLVDKRKGAVLRTRVKLDELGTEIGVLKNYEELGE